MTNVVYIVYCCVMMELAVVVDICDNADHKDVIINTMVDPHTHTSQ